MKTYKVLHLFSGIGGAALGFQEARQEYKGMLGQFETLAGIDCDPEACQDFENLTGAPAVQMDLFSRSDYQAFHGQEPPEGWQEVTPVEILESTNGEHPDVVFLSPPCKGFSGLLPSAKSKSDKYQALNRLVVRGLQLVMDAYVDNLPAVIMIENVPRITTRGEFLLKQVKHLLGSHGYVFHEGTHDCGELGGLGQRRKRYLLIARLPEKMPSFIYRPPTQRLKSIGDVIGPLPLPDDPTMGPMHRLPRLQWKTWVRLALIPAGGDWRDLNRDCYANIYQIVPWDETASTITGSHRPNNGAISVADPRLDYSPRSGAFRVVTWDDTAPTVTGSTGTGRSNGISGIADPRLPDRASRHPAVYQVIPWDEAGPCVTGTRFGSGAPAIGDPRPAQWRNGWKLSGAEGRVNEWDKPTDVVLGHSGVRSNEASCVADPRLNPKSPKFNHAYKLSNWNEPAGVIAGGVGPSNGAIVVDDPRLNCKPRNGMMGVQNWNEPAKTVIGAGDVHSGSAAVADPRIPKDTEVLDPPPIIIALDGTWHRPLTTLELAVLQSLDPFMPDGRPLQLAGNSDARWRERIGNMVPRHAARAIGEEILLSFLASEAKEEFRLTTAGIWVVPGREEEAYAIQ